MRVPLSWLAEYVPLRMPPADLAHRLTMAGLETTYDPGPGGGWEHVVVGRVVDVRPHPNADRLRLADVDTGSGTSTVVCGAPNVAAGQKIAFARVGAVLTSGKSGEPTELTAAVIRGVESAGMVCSERELGLSDEHEGILVLPGDSPVGEPLASVLPSAGALEVEVTPNRGDCLSVLGIAHETAAITGEQVTEPPAGYDESGGAIEESVSIEIADPELCSRYTCTLIRGVRIGPSPDWLRQSMQDAGHRSINNVVDVTNYVMLEYGQPLHAFDLDQVRDAKVIVRPAGDGERFTSLDGQEHELRSPMLMIADPERSIGLAGVMGGANSEMTDATRNVLLESATFNAINTRRTSNALKLRTDASLRFEKGLNPELAVRAVRRATRLILETAGGEAAQGVYDVFPGRSDPPRIPFSHNSLRRVLGVDFPTAQVTRVLSSLGFTVEQGTDGAMTVVPPYWRTDVGIEEDVVEEIARVIGYDAVEGEPLAGRVPEAIRQPERELREELRDAFVSFGLQETISHTLVSGEEAALPDGAAPLGTVNPMSQEQAYLRTSLRPALLRSAASAMRQQGGAAMFEVGRVFIPRDGDLPDEREIAAVVLAGPRGSLLWEQDTGPLGFFDAKGVVESALTRLGLSAAFERASDPLLHPGRTAAVLVNGEQVGTLGELRPQTVARYDFPVPQAALIELDVQLLAPHVPAMRSSFSAFSRYPSAVRDLALVLDAGIPARQAQAIIESGPLVVRATLFDLFEGDPLPDGKKSLAFKVEFQSPLKTLETAEVNDAVAAIVAQMERETGAALRT
ncbi:MAG: phenylalanine--tRNA ligase subunit beta [Chloroflexi bacterium]|nr:phenylalanine--tRNA ligase subunit beta [Chloroflexota bacterium]